MSNNQKEQDFALATYFPYMVRLFYRDVSQSVENVYSSVFGLSVSEWRTMSVLHDFEPLSAKEIVSRSSMDKVVVSRSISSLQEGCLLERHIDPADRRRVLLRLTRKGKDVMADLVPRVLEVERQLLAGLSEDEFELLKKLMLKVRGNAEAIEPPVETVSAARKVEAQ